MVLRWVGFWTDLVIEFLLLFFCRIYYYDVFIEEKLLFFELIVYRVSELGNCAVGEKGIGCAVGEKRRLGTTLLDLRLPVDVEPKLGDLFIFILGGTLGWLPGLAV